MVKINLLLIFNIIFLINAFAQQNNEYYITKSNDTIFGKIIRTNKFLNPDKLIFKIKDSLGKKKEIEHDNLKLIRSLKGIDGDSYIYPVYEDWYVKKIIDGKICLYILVDGSIYFISKDASKLKSTSIGGFFSRKKAHAEIEPYISDNSKILEKFKLIKATENNIISIIKEYNTLESNKI